MGKCQKNCEDMEQEYSLPNIAYTKLNIDVSHLNMTSLLPSERYICGYINMISWLWGFIVEIFTSSKVRYTSASVLSCST